MDAITADILLNTSRTIVANRFQAQSDLLPIKKSLSDIMQNYEKERVNKCALCKGTHYYTEKDCSCNKNLEHKYQFLFHIVKIINDELETEYVPQDVYLNFMSIFHRLNASTVRNIGDMIKSFIRHQTTLKRKQDKTRVFSHEEEQTIIERITKLYREKFNGALGKSVKRILQEEAEIQKTTDINLTCIQPENMTKINNMIQSFDSHIKKIKKKQLR